MSDVKRKSFILTKDENLAREWEVLGSRIGAFSFVGKLDGEKFEEFKFRETKEMMNNRMLELQDLMSRSLKHIVNSGIKEEDQWLITQII